MTKSQKNFKPLALMTILTAMILVFACFTTACQPKEASNEDLPPAQSQQENNNNETEIFVTAEPSTEPQNIATAEITVYDANELIKAPLRQPETLRLVQREDYFGDSLAYFYYDDGLGGSMYVFLDNSKKLVSYEDKSVEMALPYELTDNEYKSIALEYARNIWGYNDVEFISRITQTGLAVDGIFDFSIDGLITEINQKFHITLNGKGELRGASSYPQDVDLNKGVTVESAKETALKMLREQAHIADENNLTLVSKEISTEYAPRYILRYEYRSENPTEEEFDYDAEIHILSATGECCSVSFKFITENLDILQIDEAEQLAREAISEKFYGSKNMADRLNTTEAQTGVYWGVADDTHGPICYFFCFDYIPKEDSDPQELYSYTIEILSTGEFSDIGYGFTNN